MNRVRLFWVFGLMVIFLGSCTNREISVDPYERIMKMPDEEFKLWLIEQTDSLIPFESPDKRIPSRAYLEDLAIFRRALEEAQTGMYRFCTPQQIDSVFNSARERMNDSCDYLTFVRCIAPVYSVMGNVHGGLGHSKAYRSYRNKFGRFIPLRLRACDEKLVVRSNLSGMGQPQEGSQILSINGQSVESVCDQLMTCIFSDGNIKSMKWQIIADYFPNAYSNFVNQPDSFKLTFRDPTGAVGTCLLAAEPKVFLDSMKQVKVERPKPREPISYESLDSIKTAILTIRSFNKNVLAHYSVDFESTVDSLFSLIQEQGHTRLLLDLRNNSGGWTAYGKKLVSYLVEEPIDYIPQVYLRKHADFLIEPIITNPAGIEDTMDLQIVEGGRLQWMNYPNAAITTLPDHRFQGKLVVLINGGTASCAGVVSALLQENTDAFFVGEESATACGGTDGITMALQLPHSGLGLTLSLGWYEFATKPNLPDRGVFPDLALNDCPDTLFLDSDRVLDRAINEVN